MLPIAAPRKANITLTCRERQSRLIDSLQREDMAILENAGFTPPAAYCRPIIEVLAAMGGTGEVGRVVRRVIEIMTPVLKPDDFGFIKTGGRRCDVNTRFARKIMVDDGRLDRNAPRGFWRITAKGRLWLAAER